MRYTYVDDTKITEKSVIGTTMFNEYNNKQLIMVPSEHYGMLCEVLYPNQTGISVPLMIHLAAEFINPLHPIIKVKLSTTGSEADADWTYVTISKTPCDISSNLSSEIMKEITMFMVHNVDILTKYWNYIPNVLISDIIFPNI